MTRNQIEYAKLLETTRSNKRSEELTAENNAAVIGLQRASLDEQKRANLERERVNALTQAELSRHNAATESLGVLQFQEQQRRNAALEALELQQLHESQRANLAREAETARANRAGEAEARRSHLATENEARRSNLAFEQFRLKQLDETHRANVAGEILTGSRIALDTLVHEQNLAETQRSHRASEANAAGQLAETVRHHLATEAKDWTPQVNVTSTTAPPNLGVNVQVIPQTSVTNSTSTKLNLQQDRLPGNTVHTPRLGDIFGVLPKNEGGSSNGGKSQGSSSGRSKSKSR